MRFLALVIAHRAGSVARTDEEIAERVESLADTLRDVDPPAFARPGNWWSLVFEQMRHGLL